VIEVSGIGFELARFVPFPAHFATLVAAFGLQKDIPPAIKRELGESQVVKGEVMRLTSEFNRGLPRVHPLAGVAF
jgi:hypothetical protein